MENSRIKIIDDILPFEDYCKLKTNIENSHFPWYFKPGIDFYDDGKSQFTHNIYENYAPQSSLFNDIIPILNLLEVKAIIRIKANLQTKTKAVEENSFHIDYENCKTAVYYINTNNGYTFFETGEKVESIANRLVLFDSNILHAGTSCSDELCRIVINLNYV